MSEIEVKVLNINITELKLKLNAIGAVQVKKENQINNIYDFEDGRFSKQKGYVRLRQVENLFDNTNTIILGFKKMISQDKFKHMVEEETYVTDFQSAENILFNLGLKKIRSDKKFRESYKLKDYLYEIDTWDEKLFDEPYLEVEALDEAGLNEALSLIGYSINDATSKTLGELIADKKLKN